MLRSFHAVALHGGFSAAARALHISQPTLSTQVKALETNYDVELFSRIGRKTRLTPTGSALYQTTLRLTQNESEAEDLLNSFKGLHSGSLRIAAVGPFHAIDMIVAFKLRHPKIDVSVQFGNSRRSFERLLAYEADIGIIAEVDADPLVVTLPYSSHEVVVFANSAHPLFDRDSISIHELTNQKVVQREIGSTTRIAMERALQDYNVSIDVVLEIGSREGIWKAVEQGLGIGFVADFEFVPHPNLRAIPIHDVDISTQYFLAYLKERQLSRLIRAFCEVAQT
ncbi:MAG: LysR family transcriptional regulator [Rhodobacteraceae bacterium]|nr:LysR family transcriptional regulator [Paracoccaceae bacterium]